MNIRVWIRDYRELAVGITVPADSPFDYAKNKETVYNLIFEAATISTPSDMQYLNTYGIYLHNELVTSHQYEIAYTLHHEYRSDILQTLENLAAIPTATVIFEN